MVNLRTLDLNLLVVFEAIYSAANISHASKKLGVSQPTISNSLARLRETLDDPLFVRSGRGVKPTPKATQMIGPVREALAMIEGGVKDGDEFDPVTTRRHFRILMIDLLEPLLMPSIIRRIQDHRSITLEALPIATTPFIEGLNDGSLDLVLSAFFGDAEDIVCEALVSSNLVMVARKGHPVVKDELTLEHFNTLGHIALIPQMRAMSRLEEELHRLKLERHVVYTVSKFWSFPHILATTDLIAIMPSGFAALAAKTQPLNIFPPPFEIPQQKVYMTWKKNRERDLGHAWLRGQIKQALAESLAAG